jgi:hypothetical protein
LHFLNVKIFFWILFVFIFSSSFLWKLFVFFLFLLNIFLYLVSLPYRIDFIQL